MHACVGQSADKLGAGDVIAVELDADARTVTFRKNDDSDFIGVARKIERGEYHIAVLMRNGGDAVSLVSAAARR